MSGHHYIFTEMSERINGCQFTLNSQKFRAQVLVFEEASKIKLAKKP